MPDNVRAGKPDGKYHRKDTAACGNGEMVR